MPFVSNEYAEQYASCKDKYNEFGQNLVQALKKFLEDENLSFLRVYYRIKEDSSFLEKIERKQYKNPFDEIEDICGIRIICYYKRDVDAISKILKREFEILENQDKGKLLKDDQFGYRSTHFIVKIKDEWTKAPNFRGHNNLKAEIQVRTVLMHSWAEIEHKLAYKNDEQIPTQFKRDFAGLSALLEIADKEFERLRQNISNYQSEIKKEFEKNHYEDIEMNLNSLETFLSKHFPNRESDDRDRVRLFNEFMQFNISLSDLFRSLRRVENYLPQVEEDYLLNTTPFSFFTGSLMTQEGLARFTMYLTNETYFFNKNLIKPIKDIIIKWKKTITQEEIKNRK